MLAISGRPALTRARQGRSRVGKAGAPPQSAAFPALSARRFRWTPAESHYWQCAKGELWGTLAPSLTGPAIGRRSGAFQIGSTHPGTPPVRKPGQPGAESPRLTEILNQIRTQQAGSGARYCRHGPGLRGRVRLKKSEERVVRRRTACPYRAPAHGLLAPHPTQILKQIGTSQAGTRTRSGIPTPPARSSSSDTGGSGAACRPPDRRGPRS